MKRKHLIALGACVLFMSLLLMVLYVISPISKSIYRASFERIFALESGLHQPSVLDLGVNSYYISGTTSRTVYLSNYTSPFHLLVTGVTLKDSTHVNINLSGIDSLFEPLKFRTVVDSPYFFLSNGTMPTVLRGDVNSWTASPLVQGDAAYFVDALPINRNTLILRSVEGSEKAFELARLTSTITPHFTFSYDLLEKQIDGLFCEDGSLNYSKELNRVIYVYSYRNQYVVADTNLNLSYRGNTIDTFSVARIRIVNTNDTGESMLASPPAIINGRTCVSDNYLFVQSNLLSKNEVMLDFARSTVIDVYDLNIRKYITSFYIPDYHNQKISSFKVTDKKLVAIFGRYLAIFDLDIDNLNHSNRL